MQELKEHENNLSQREAILSARWQDFDEQVAMAQQRQTQNGYPYGNPAPYPQSYSTNPYAALKDRAREDGITLYTAGSRNPYATHNEQVSTQSTPAPAKKTGTYSVGSTLFKAAIITLCIVAFESILFFFMKDYMQIPAYYPAIGFGVGFIAFVVCSILYAINYRPNARRKKNPSYWLTAGVVTVIGMIIVTMIAVYLKADLGNLPQLLSFVIAPVAYIANIMIFTAFYYLFSKRDDTQR